MPAMPPQAPYLHPLTAYRRRHKLTLEQLGAMAIPPMHKSTLWRIENGEKMPSSRALIALTAACGGEVTADEILRATPKEVAA
jgi:transcriptional regulator with XRE-family HTH domain